MIIRNQNELTDAVIAVMERTADPRLREITVSLVRHLHAFVRDVRLTEDEFRTAAALLARLGQQTTDTHNEVVLMAGSLGVSSLVCLLNNGNNGTTETSQNLLGPFWRLHSPRVENGGSIVRSATPGPALFMRGRVVDREGRPIAGADVDIWHSSPVGLYENQDPAQADMNLRGTFTPSLPLPERGDATINEIEASWIGYRAQVVRPVYVEVIDPAQAELIKVQREIFNRVLENLKPGVTVGDLAALTKKTAAEVAPKTGPAAGAVGELNMHGRGQGDDGPIITPHAKSPRQLAVAMRENMVFICKPSANSADGEYICQWGDTVVVTKNGGRRLGKRPHELAVTK